VAGAGAQRPRDHARSLTSPSGPNALLHPGGRARVIRGGRLVGRCTVGRRSVGRRRRGSRPGPLTATPWSPAWWGSPRLSVWGLLSDPDRDLETASVLP